jgi:hypothetical protein
VGNLSPQKPQLCLPRVLLVTLLSKEVGTRNTGAISLREYVRVSSILFINYGLDKSCARLVSYSYSLPSERRDIMSVTWGKAAAVRRYRIKLHNGPNQETRVACAASFQDAVLIASALERDGATIDDIELWEIAEPQSENLTARR